MQELAASGACATRDGYYGCTDATASANYILPFATTTSKYFTQCNTSLKKIRSGNDRRTLLEKLIHICIHNCSSSWIQTGS